MHLPPMASIIASSVIIVVLLGKMNSLSSVVHGIMNVSIIVGDMNILKSKKFNTSFDGWRSIAGSEGNSIFDKLKEGKSPRSVIISSKLLGL